MYKCFGNIDCSDNTDLISDLPTDDLIFWHLYCKCPVFLFTVFSQLDICINSDPLIFKNRSPAQSAQDPNDLDLFISLAPFFPLEGITVVKEV